MKIALISMEVVPGRPDRNTKTICQKIREAKAAGAELAVCPAFCLSGRFLGRELSQPAFLRDCMDDAQDIARAAEGIAVLFGSIADEAERPVSDGRTLLSARDGALQEVARRPLHASSPFSPLIYALPEEDILIAVDAAPFPTPLRGAGLAALARKHRKTVVYVNALGLQDKGKTVYAFDGVCRVCRADGSVVLTTPPYEDGITVVDTAALTSCETPAKEPEVAPIYRTLRYGVRKFLERIHMERVVVGISGGIDSAVSAALYVDAIGADRVLLVNMPSRFNSATTKGLAAQLAERLGCRSMIVPIEESVAHTVAQLTEISVEGAAAAPGERLKISSFVRENMQARDRSGRVLATIAAAWGAGFTCNGNKAESTVGYATLYGDQA
ncbi:NAD(+) synthase, partial [Selenomonas sp. F0473]|uniref:NAD(+) synthase n=1 Tax=Selenomonas sp. F0473 TaxID=999423 RepID=UPI0025F9B746